MKILINGETKELLNDLYLSELIEHFSLGKEKIAIELNKEVVRKKDWENIKLTDGDKLEVIHFVGGG